MSNETHRGEPLTIADVGRALLRRDRGEWRVERDHDGKWTLHERHADFRPLPIVVEAENEEEASRKICEAVALDPYFTQGIPKDGEV